MCFAILPSFYKVERLGIGIMQALIYSSRALLPFDPPALEDLAAQAAQRNAALDVTGYLYFDGRRFLQYLEGTVTQLERLMQQIERDERHHIYCTLVQKELRQRRFPLWHMQYLSQGSKVAIRLEHILADFMLLKVPPQLDHGGLARKTWDLVDKIAEQQYRFGLLDPF